MSDWIDTLLLGGYDRTVYKIASDTKFIIVCNFFEKHL